MSALMSLWLPPSTLVTLVAASALVAASCVLAGRQSWRLSIGESQSRRCTEVLEDQGGPPWWYLAHMPRYFGELIYVPLAITIWSVLRKRATNGTRAMLLWATIPYLIFSACATKAPGYVMIAAPSIFLLEAEVWLRLFQERRRLAARRGTPALLAVVLSLLAFLPARYLLEPTGPLEREATPSWARDLRALPSRIGAGPAVLFNVSHSIEAMFYTPYLAYPHFPDAAQARALQQHGYRVYIFDDGSSPMREIPPEVIVIGPE